MKKQFTTKMKVLTAVGVLSTMSLTAIATPIIQEVSANLRKDITFTLNGEKVLEGASTLQYNDTTYIPARVLIEELGFKVDYKDGNIAITQATNTATRNVEGIEQLPELEGVPISQATIKSINKTDKQVLIVTADEREIMLNTGELDLTELAVDMTVRVIHSPAMTRSLPPQTAAFEITPVQEVKPLENVTLENVVIAEISEDGKTITVGQSENPEDPNNQTILHLSEETVIKHHMNKMLYKAEALEKGQKLTVVHSPIMTLSLPGQTTAIEIILMD